MMESGGMDQGVPVIGNHPLTTQNATSIDNQVVLKIPLLLKTEVRHLLSEVKEPNFNMEPPKHLEQRGNQGHQHLEQRGNQGHQHLEQLGNQGHQHVEQLGNQVHQHVEQLGNQGHQHVEQLGNQGHHCGAGALSNVTNKPLRTLAVWSDKNQAFEYVQKKPRGRPRKYANHIQQPMMNRMPNASGDGKEMNTDNNDFGNWRNLAKPSMVSDYNACGHRFLGPGAHCKPYGTEDAPFHPVYVHEEPPDSENRGILTLLDYRGKVPLYVVGPERGDSATSFQYVDEDLQSLENVVDFKLKSVLPGDLSPKKTGMPYCGGTLSSPPRCKRKRDPSGSKVSHPKANKKVLASTSNIENVPSHEVSGTGEKTEQDANKEPEQLGPVTRKRGRPRKTDQQNDLDNSSPKLTVVADKVLELSPKPSSEDGKKQRGRKPALPFAELIEFALTDAPLTVNAIYQWILTQYPRYTKKNMESWKSSVRHALSKGPQFEKLQRVSGGYLWGLRATKAHWKKQKLAEYNVDGTEECVGGEKQNSCTEEDGEPPPPPPQADQVPQDNESVPQPPADPTSSLSSPGALGDPSPSPTTSPDPCVTCSKRIRANQAANHYMMEHSYLSGMPPYLPPWLASGPPQYPYPQYVAPSAAHAYPPPQWTGLPRPPPCTGMGYTAVPRWGYQGYSPMATSPWQQPNSGCRVTDHACVGGQRSSTQSAQLSTNPRCPNPHNSTTSPQNVISSSNATTHSNHSSPSTTYSMTNTVPLGNLTSYTNASSYQCCPTQQPIKVPTTFPNVASLSLDTFPPVYPNRQTSQPPPPSNNIITVFNNDED